MLRIWFARAYESAAGVIAMIRDNPDGRPVCVIGTHTDPDSPVLRACDESGPEPELDAADHVEWALDFVREHRVDVLVPRPHMAALADVRERFAAAGTTLLCAQAEAVRVFADKARTYAAATELGLPVPPHRIVHDAAGLRGAYADLSAAGTNVCMKPLRGSNGSGYRILTSRAPRLADFAGQATARADLAAVGAALEDAERKGELRPELLIMPYLTGPEISMDVLSDPDGEPVAVIGRTRSRRRRTLVDDPPARQVAEILTRAHGIAYLSNIQVRYWQGPEDAEARPYLLDVNTRISGGLPQTALAGVNLPWDAVRLLRGEPVDPPTPRFGAAYTTGSTLIPLA